MNNITYMSSSSRHWSDASPRSSTSSSASTSPGLTDHPIDPIAVSRGTATSTSPSSSTTTPYGSPTSFSRQTSQHSSYVSDVAIKDQSHRPRQEYYDSYGFHSVMPRVSLCSDGSISPVATRNNQRQHRRRSSAGSGDSLDGEYGDDSTFGAKDVLEAERIARNIVKRSKRSSKK